MKPLKPPRPLEKTIYEAICVLLKLAGFTVYRLSQARESRQTKGLPDLYAFAPALLWCNPRPTAVWIEVKRPRHRPSEVRPEQRAFGALCAERDIAHVTGDHDHVADWLISWGFLERVNGTYRRVRL